MQYLIGRTLGRFRIDDMIGEGGKGVVYRAVIPSAEAEL